MSKIPPVLMHAASFATCAGEFMVERTPPHLYAGERALLGLVLPPFQRPAVWDVGRQRQFVESLFLEGTGEAYDGEIRISRDGDRVSLPAGGTAMDYENVLSR